MYAEQAHPDAPGLNFVRDVKTRGRRGPTRSASERYDGRITLLHEVPTRADNWHDLLNALCFATFPRAKGALHRRQYLALRAVDPGPDVRWPSARTREQDALTLLDEGGAVVATACQALADALGRTMVPAEVAEACASGRARVVPFGHALLEHLVLGMPCPFAGARVVYAAVDLADEAALTRAVDEALTDMLCDPTQFTEPHRAGLQVTLMEDGAEFAIGERVAFARTS